MNKKKRVLPDNTRGVAFLDGHVERVFVEAWTNLKQESGIL